MIEYMTEDQKEELREDMSNRDGRRLKKMADMYKSFPSVLEIIKEEIAFRTKCKVCLGDSVYCQADNGCLILTSENGVGILNTIYIDEYGIDALIKYLRRTGVMD